MKSIEANIAKVASPSPRGSITPEDSRYTATFTTGSNEKVVKWFASVAECCQWINKMEVAQVAGKFNKSLDNAGKASAKASVS